MREIAVNQSSNALKAVIFDYDNTLGLTERVALAEACKLAREALDLSTAALPKRDFRSRFEGRIFYDILGALDTRKKLSEEERQTLSLIEKERVKAKLALRMKETAGSSQLLAALAQSGYTLCVCSSSARDRIMTCLKAAQQEAFFSEERIFSAHDLKPIVLPKPHPAVYEFVLQTLAEIRASQALAVEDSVSGVRSATRADGGRLQCAGYVGALAKTAQRRRAIDLLAAGASFVVSHMSQLRGAIELIQAGEQARLKKKFGMQHWSNASRPS